MTEQDTLDCAPISRSSLNDLGIRSSMTNEEFELFRTFVREQTGISLGESKKLLLEARLCRRLKVCGVSTFRDYYRVVRERDPQGHELREMINCVTTNKTSFFRESTHFDFLVQKVLPGIRERARAGGSRQVRMWSAPCSTGEEAYSIAITVAEALSPLDTWDIKILGSDLDTNVLAHAQRGIYDQVLIDNIPVEVRHKYFLRGKNAASGLASVKPSLRSLVEFRHINLIEANWPIRSQFDVIFCRNLLIYFDRTTQETLVGRLLKQLKPDGYLVVGQSEYLHWMRDGVESVGGTVYRAKTIEAVAVREGM